MCGNCQTIFKFSRVLDKFSKRMLRRNRGTTFTIPVSSQKKNALVSKYIQARSSYEITLLNNMEKFINGSIGLDDYLKMQKSAIHSAFTSAYSIGKTFGTDNGTIDDIERRFIVQQVTKEMQFMKNFANDVQNQSGVMDYNKRMKMYSSSLDAMFGFGRLVYLPDETRIIWTLGATDKHCVDCLSFAAKNPYTKQTLPGMPKSGASRCLSNCLCSLVYYHDKQLTYTDYENFILNKKYANVKDRKIPSESEYKHLMDIRDTYYYNRYMYELTKNQVYKSNYMALLKAFSTYKQKNKIYFPVYFNSAQVLRDLKSFNKNGKFQFVSDYTTLKTNEFVSFFQSDKQIYGKVVGIVDKYVKVRTIEKLDYLLHPDTHVLFKEL